MPVIVPPEAYEASRYIIERLKERVPIWKQEISGGKKGEWVHGV